MNLLTLISSNDIISLLGTQVFSTIVVGATLTFGLWYIYKNYIKKDIGNKPRKILIVKSLLIMVAGIECWTAAYATVNGEQGMVFGVRLGLHGAMLALNAAMTYSIWGEVREAIISLKILGRLFTNSSRLTFSLIVSIVFNFFMQWAQVILNMSIAMLSLFVNLGLMGISTGQLDLVLHATHINYITEAILFSDGITRDVPVYYWTVIGEMRDDVAGCFLLTILHCITILALGAMSFDGSDIESSVNDRQKRLTEDNVWGYFSKIISPGLPGITTKMDINLVKELFTKISTDKFSNLVRAEDYVRRAIDYRDIMEDKEGKYSMEARSKANADLQRLNADMLRFMEDTEKKVATATSTT